MNVAATEVGAPARAPVLVIGVGSELRSDDAAGRHVVDVIRQLALPRIEVRSVHQLTPELAAAASGRRLVIVIDASVEVEELTVANVERSASTGSMSHHLDVGSLIALAEVVGRPPEQVVTVAIPAHDLGLGTELSPDTARWLLAAAGRVTELCEEALGHLA